jgi:hypothetical protein
MPALVQPFCTQSRRRLVRVDLVQLPHRALLRVARIGARTRAGSWAWCGSSSSPTPAPRALRWRCRSSWTSSARPAGHPRRLGEQRLGLDQDHLAAALEIAVQALAVAHAQVLRSSSSAWACSSAASSPSCWKRCAARRAGALRAELLHRLPGLVLEARLAAVQMVEAARDLAGDLDVRHLVLAHRHQPRGRSGCRPTAAAGSRESRRSTGPC